LRIVLSSGHNFGNAPFSDKKMAVFAGNNAPRAPHVTMLFPLPIGLVGPASSGQKAKKRGGFFLPHSSQSAIAAGGQPFDWTLVDVTCSHFMYQLEVEPLGNLAPEGRGGKRLAA
jgi:hypothetical protein